MRQSSSMTFSSVAGMRCISYHVPLLEGNPMVVLSPCDEIITYVLLIVICYILQQLSQRTIQFWKNI